MQATLTIDDDLLAEARKAAAARSVSVDTLVAESLRQFLQPASVRKSQFHLPTFEVPPGTPPITLEDEQRVEED